MTPATILALISLAAEILKIAAPLVPLIVNGKAIPAESQLALMAAVDRLRKQLDSGELGDHWKVE
jgi:hypothetical protein